MFLDFEKLLQFLWIKRFYDEVDRAQFDASPQLVLLVDRADHDDAR